MAKTNVSNKGIISGMNGITPIELASDAVITDMIDGLTITKIADKKIWAGGELTYTINIEYNENDTLSNAKFSDTLDITKIELAADSVKIDGVLTTYAYDAGTGLLEVELGNIDADYTAEITFQVTKKTVS